MAERDLLGLRANKDPWAPQGFKEIWDFQDPRAKRDLLEPRAEGDLLDLMAKKDPWVPRGFKEIWVSKDLLDLLAKQGLEVKLVKEDLKAIKESRVQWDFQDPRAKRDLLEPRAERDLLDLRAKKDP